MFAFAIYDPKRNGIFIARDRFGKKPLHYIDDPDGFYFASEIKALLAIDEIRLKVSVDPCSLSDFLSLGYILTPKTAYKEIRQLPAAHAAFYSIDQKCLRVWLYWKLEDFVARDPAPYDNIAKQRFSEILEDAVRLRLRADVEVMGHLSGGLDSSSLMAIATKLSKHPIRATCIGFDDASYDESVLARQSATALGPVDS